MPAKGQDNAMQTSIFLARLVGPFFAIVGLSVLVNAAAFRSIAREFLNSPGLIFLTGLVTLPVGIAIVLTHNVWVANWPVLITIVGWLGVITGVIRVFAPQRVAEKGKTIAANHNFPYVAGGIWLAVGAVLCFFGYVR
jgi:hypothetical protein